MCASSAASIAMLVAASPKALGRAISINYLVCELFYVARYALSVERLDTGKLMELRREVDGFGFEFGDDGVQVKGQPSGPRVVVSAGRLDSVERQAEVLQDALSHFEATESFAAGPVKKAMEVAAFGQFEKNFGHIGSGAGLAHFIAE